MKRRINKAIEELTTAIAEERERQEEIHKTGVDHKLDCDNCKYYTTTQHQGMKTCQLRTIGKHLDKLGKLADKEDKE
jgi:hypothetical protein